MKTVKAYSKRIIIAACLSTAWAFMAQNQYGYNYNFPKLLNLNTFPLIAWTIGLVAMYLIYSVFARYMKNHSLLKSLLLFIILYWPLIIIAEYIGYYIFNLHNTATSMYSGLPICNCMHAPTWMQFMYFALGPIFLLLCHMFRLEKQLEKSVDK